MLLHCAKPGDSGTYRMTITNSSGTASCSASLSIRSESRICLFLHYIFTDSFITQSYHIISYRMTITNSASCSASLSIRSESWNLFCSCISSPTYFPPRKDDLVHTNANPISPLCAEESLLQSGPVQLHLLLLLCQLLLLLLLVLLQLLLQILFWQTLCTLFILPLLPLATLYCYSCYLNKAMLTIKIFRNMLEIMEICWRV